MTIAAEPMTRRVIVVPPTLPLADVWAVMKRERFRHLPVVEGGRLLGIVSDRDVLKRAEHHPERELEVPDLTAAESMTPCPFVCAPTTDVRDIVNLMTGKKIDAVPVVNDDLKLVGLVTSTDLMLLLIRLEEAKLPPPFEFEIEEVGEPALC